MQLTTITQMQDGQPLRLQACPLRPRVAAHSISTTPPSRLHPPPISPIAPLSAAPSPPVPPHPPPKASGLDPQPRASTLPRPDPPRPLRNLSRHSNPILLPEFGARIATTLLPSHATAPSRTKPPPQPRRSPSLKASHPIPRHHLHKPAPPLIPTRLAQVALRLPPAAVGSAARPQRATSHTKPLRKLALPSVWALHWVPAM